MRDHEDQAFTTQDSDHDHINANCAVKFHGAWWYNKCLKSNLNGHYLGGRTDVFAKGVVWKDWKGLNYSLKKTEMKIRPIADRVH